MARARRARLLEERRLDRSLIPNERPSLKTRWRPFALSDGCWGHLRLERNALLVEGRGRKIGGIGATNGVLRVAAGGHAGGRLQVGRTTRRRLALLLIAVLPLCGALATRAGQVFLRFIQGQAAMPRPHVGQRDARGRSPTQRLALLERMRRF